MATDNDRDPERQASVHPTRVSTLVVAALATAALAAVAISRFYGDFPPFPWLPALTLLAFAAVELGLAANTKARIDRRDGAPRVNPLQVARYVALAKASALAGALFGGAYASFTLWLFTERGQNVHAADDLVPATAGLLGAIVLTVAALRLERSCRIPPPPPDASPTGKTGEAEPDPQEAG